MELIRQELSSRLQNYGINIGRGYSSFMFRPFYGFTFMYRDRNFRIFYHVDEEVYSLIEIRPLGNGFHATQATHVNRSQIGNLCNFIANI